MHGRTEHLISGKHITVIPKAEMGFGKSHTKITQQPQSLLLLLTSAILQLSCWLRNSVQEPPAPLKTPVTSQTPASSPSRTHPVVVPPISSLSHRPKCTHLGVVSSPESSFTPGTAWPTATGTGFPATTVREQKKECPFLSSRSLQGCHISHTAPQGLILFTEHLLKESSTADTLQLPEMESIQQSRVVAKNQKVAIAEVLQETKWKESAS